MSPSGETELRVCEDTAGLNASTRTIAFNAGRYTPRTMPDRSAYPVVDVLHDLRDATTEACKDYYSEANLQLHMINAHYNARDRAQNKYAERTTAALRAAEGKAEELQREVSALREELGHYENRTREFESPADFMNLAHAFDPEQIWRARHYNPEQLQDILQNKYTLLYDNLKTFVRSWSSLRAKVLQHKEKLRHWDKQLERDEFTLLLHGKPVTFRKLQNSTSQDVNGAALSTHSTSEIQNCLNSQVNRDQSGVTNSTRTRTPGTNGDAQTGSVGLQAPVSPQRQERGSQSACIKRDPASLRSASNAIHAQPETQTRKRKRVIGASHSKSTRNCADGDVRVKEESLSSSPVQLKANSPDRQLPSTQDLDEIGDTVQTPTKRQKHQEAGRQESTAVSYPVGVDSLIPPSCRTSQHSAVLQPLNGNSRTPRGTHPSSDRKKPRQTDQLAVSLMAEDGDYTQSNVSSVKKTPSTSKFGGHAAQNRLGGLLEGRFPRKSTLGPPDQCCNPSDLRVSKNSASLEKQSIHEGAPASGLPYVHPDDEPYRSRPLHRQNLSHFKINPARNKGLDFAYDAVVRRKEDRKCLSGCTRPGCCGDDFRAMARLGALPAGGSEGKETEDQRILEEYARDDRSLLNGLNAHDRENILIEARARVLADRYAKHRHDHQRARTPPGFWRTEMPSTQELESDREAAQRVERDKVEERYREAMRPGGLWTWADE